MAAIPHPDDHFPFSCGFAVVTVSDSRTVETDRSGQTIKTLLESQGYSIVHYAIVADEPELIQGQLSKITAIKDCEVIIFNGGTGIAPRDTTYDVLAQNLTKTLPGFGELFRYLSYQEIGSRAIASRALGGIYQDKLIFSVPGSTKAVQLAMEQLILPEIRHLITQLKQPK
jgi:molybdenum cofactor biosynthesis protein B